MFQIPEGLNFSVLTFSSGFSNLSIFVPLFIAMRFFSALEPKCVVSAWLGIKSHSAGVLQWLIGATLWGLYIPLLLHPTNIQTRELIHGMAPNPPHVALSQEEEVPWRWWGKSLCQVFPLGCTVPNCWECETCKPSETWGRSWKLQRPPCCQRVPHSLCCLGWGNTTQRRSGGKTLPFKLTSYWGRSEPDLTSF